jgi:hypothetical protein
MKKRQFGPDQKNGYKKIAGSGPNGRTAIVYGYMAKAKQAYFVISAAGLT